MEVGDQIDVTRIAAIQRSGEPRRLPPLEVDAEAVAALAVRTEQHGATTVAEILERNQAHSLVVLDHAGLAFEWYAPDATADQPNLCYSVTKSFTGTLAALAVHEGALDRSARVGDLLPDLDGTGFADATVGEVADMTVAIAYDEDYAEAGDARQGDGPLGFGDYMVALGMEEAPAGSPSPSIRSLLARMQPARGPHGHTFAYATPVTDVLGWLLESATQHPYAELLTEQLWSHIGAEHDAVLAFDPAGTPMMGAGLAMTTRDLARFGLLVAEQGRPGVDEIVPVSVLDAIRNGGDEATFQRGGEYGYLTGYSYRDQWWMPGGASRPMSAWGIHGQVLWVEPDAQVVVASHCGGPLPSDERRDVEQDAMCRALTAFVASHHTG